jgi:ribose 5-phosphate isomerase B
MLRVGIAADHGGLALKVELTASLRDAGYEIEDYGAFQLAPDDDYPDFIVPFAPARFTMSSPRIRALKMMP